MLALFRGLRRFVRTWSINTLNTAVYVLSFGRKTLHEGRYCRWLHRWSNWSRTFTSRPARFAQAIVSRDAGILPWPWRQIDWRYAPGCDIRAP